MALALPVLTGDLCSARAWRLISVVPGPGQCLHSYLPSSHSQHRYGNLARNTHINTHKWEKWDMGSWHKIWRRVVTSVPMSLMSHINPDPDVSDVTAHVSHGIPHPRAVWPCVETRDGVLGVIPTQSYTHAHYQDGWFTLSLSNLPHVKILAVSVRIQYSMLLLANMRERNGHNNMTCNDGALRW